MGHDHHHDPPTGPPPPDLKPLFTRVLLLSLNSATVHRVLTRYRLARLTHLDRAAGRAVRRYEHDAPGELIHVDIKKLDNIPEGRRTQDPRPRRRQHSASSGHHPFR